MTELTIRALGRVAFAAALVSLAAACAPAPDSGDAGGDSTLAPAEIGGDPQPYVFAGYDHSCFIWKAPEQFGELNCWGRNDYGQLGGGDTGGWSEEGYAVDGDDWETVALGETHTCGVRMDGSLWCWGRGTYNMTGQGNTNTYNTPQRVGTGTGWVGVTADRNATCAWKSNGTAYCFGQNVKGRLPGVSSWNQMRLAQLTSVPGGWQQIDLAAEHACGLGGDGKLRCWGGNGYGQLARGSVGSQGAMAVVPGSGWTTVSTGGGTSCAIGGAYQTADDEYSGEEGEGPPPFATHVTQNIQACAGLNAQGQLALADTTNRSTLTTPSVSVFDGYLGGKVSPAADEFDMTIWFHMEADQVAVGPAGTVCSVVHRNVLWDYFGEPYRESRLEPLCWGGNTSGQVSYWGYDRCVLDPESGEWTCTEYDDYIPVMAPWQDGYMGYSDGEEGEGLDGMQMQVAVGRNHVCTVVYEQDEDGFLVEFDFMCEGDNSYGQLGYASGE